MKIGSLCAGIGGLEAGVPGELAWTCEVDPHASLVLDHRFGVPNHGDLTTVDWSTVEPVDVLTAGYPCQPFSTAGRREGTNDARHLWPHVAEAIRGLRPRYVLLENVRGHLSLGFGAVLGDLADLGFDAEWCVLRASDVGAPHRRERVFVVARAADANGVAGAASESRGRRPGEMGGPRAFAGVVPALGLEGVGVVAGGAGPTADADGGAGTQRDGGTHEPRLAAPRRGDVAGRGVPPRRPLGRYELAVARWERHHGPAPDPLDDRGRLAPAFVEWMMGYPAGWVTDLDLPRTAQLRCLGNAVVPQCSALAWSTLTARCDDMAVAA